MRFPETKKSKVDSEGLIPLINIVFLLLLFFLVVGHISSMETSKIDLAVAGEGGNPPAPERTVYIDQSGQFLLDIEPIDIDRIAASLLLFSVEDGADNILRLAADYRLPASNLIEAVALLQAAGFERISLITIAKP